YFDLFVIDLVASGVFYTFVFLFLLHYTLLLLLISLLFLHLPCHQSTYRIHIENCEVPNMYSTQILHLLFHEKTRYVLTLPVVQSHLPDSTMLNNLWTEGLHIITI